MSHSLPYQVIKIARDAIADPDKWTQGAFSRSKKGRSLAASSSRSHAFCSVGALWAAASALTRNELQCRHLMFRACEELMGAQESPAFALMCFNDENDHEAVLALFDRYLAA
jgi:hypothetical protein